MTEEKKGFSFFKFLLTLCILGGLVAGGLWVYQQQGTKDNWADVIKQKISEAKKYLPKTNKTEIKTSDKAPATSQPESTLPPEQSPESTDSETVDENIEMDVNVVPDTLPPMVMDSMPLDSEAVIKEDSKTSDTVDTVNTIEPNEIKEDQEKAPEEEAIAEGHPSPTIENQTQENVSETQKATNSDQKLYTWKNFISGKKCNDTMFPQFNETTKKKLLSYCQHPSADAWYLWLNNFREAKKRFFIQEVLKENSQYFKYLKTIPYLLFDVQKTKTEGDSLHDQFDKIESAIINKQTEEAVNLIKQMNHPEAKKALNGILLEGQNLLEIQSAFENK